MWNRIDLALMGIGRQQEFHIVQWIPARFSEAVEKVQPGRIEYKSL